MKDKHGHDIAVGDLMFSDAFGRDTLVVQVHEIIFSSDATLGEGGSLTFAQRRKDEAPTEMTQEALLKSRWIYHSTPERGRSLKS